MTPIVIQVGRCAGCQRFDHLEHFACPRCRQVFGQKAGLIILTIRGNPAIALRLYRLMPPRSRPRFVRMFGNPTHLRLVRDDGPNPDATEIDAHEVHKAHMDGAFEAMPLWLDESRLSEALAGLERHVKQVLSRRGPDAQDVERASWILAAVWKQLTSRSSASTVPDARAPRSCDSVAGCPSTC